jgi:hypothetical protein
LKPKNSLYVFGTSIGAPEFPAEGRGNLANSRFHHKPDPKHRPNSKLEAAYYQADKAIQNIVDLLAAA